MRPFCSVTNIHEIGFLTITHEFKKKKSRKTFSPAFQVREKLPLAKASQGLIVFSVRKTFWIKKRECVQVYIYIDAWTSDIKKDPGVYILDILFDVFLWL